MSQRRREKMSLLAMWVADLALFRSPTPFIPLRFDFTLDWRAFAFCFGAAMTEAPAEGLITFALFAFNQEKYVREAVRAASQRHPRTSV